MKMFERSGFNLLERSLDASALRQKVTANNIANVDTPGFKRSEVVFESLLQKETESRNRIAGYVTHEKHIPIGSRVGKAEARIVRDDSELKMNNNGNNVDMDYEMALMAKNQLQYNLLVQQINHEFRQLRTSIGGR